MEDGFAREAMETVSANSRLPKLFSQGKPRGSFGQGSMESGVKAGELRDAGEQTLCLANQGHRRWNMQRRELGCRLQLFQDLRSNFLIDEGWAPMNYPMAHAAECLKPQARQLRGHDSDRVRLLWNSLRFVAEDPSIGRPNPNSSLTRSDSFHRAAINCTGFVVLCDEHAELKRRGAAIEREES